MPDAPASEEAEYCFTLHLFPEATVSVRWEMKPSVLSIFLAAAGQTLWQILPLGPPGCGNSPYSCFSAFAGNPLLIDLQQLSAEGDLDVGELKFSLLLTG